MQGAELLTTGTDALVQVENDDGRAYEEAERDKEREKKVAQEVRRAAALTPELAAPSEEKVCATIHLAFVESSLSTLRRFSSHFQATVMQDPWIGSRRPSARESRATTSAPPQTNSCVLAKKNTLALTGGFRGARPRSAARKRGSEDLG